MYQNCNINRYIEDTLNLILSYLIVLNCFNLQMFAAVTWSPAEDAELQLAATGLSYRGNWNFNDNQNHTGYCYFPDTASNQHCERRWCFCFIYLSAFQFYIWWVDRQTCRAGIITSCAVFTSICKLKSWNTIESGDWVRNVLKGFDRDEETGCWMNECTRNQMHTHNMFSLYCKIFKFLLLLFHFSIFTGHTVRGPAGHQSMHHQPFYLVWVQFPWTTKWIWSVW